MDRQVKFILSEIKDELKKTTRRQDDIEKTLTLIFQDREILEDIQGSIKHLQEIILANQQHQDTARNSLKSDVKRVEFAVQDKVDQVKNTISDKTVIVKSSTGSIFKKIIALLPKRGGKHD